MTSKADILLVTATKTESQKVLEVFETAAGRQAKPVPIGDRIYFDLGEINDVRVSMVQSATMGTASLGASLQTVEKGIEALGPIAVIMVGIAFGADSRKQKIGDILVAEHLRYYELERVGTDKNRRKKITRSDRPSSTPWLLNRLKSADLSWVGAKVHFGVLVTGEKLIDNLDLRNEVMAMEPEAIGGEMEGAGLYSACQDKHVGWILVKGICDWADGNKSQMRTSRQAQAAKNSASFILHTLRFTHFSPPPAIPDSTHYPVAKLPQVRSSLPPIGQFFGREKELEIIADAIAPESRTWVVLIDGPGGIGKTALAVYAAYSAPVSNYPQKVFLTAKKRELTPSGEQSLLGYNVRGYLDLLSELAAELGYEQLGQMSEEQRPSAVRRAMVGMRILLVIDNVESFSEEDRNRLFQFLRRLPEGCKAIITSRMRNDLDARPIRLDRLDRDDAYKLLGDLAKTNTILAANRKDWARLYEATGGNPLLMKWTASQLGRKRSQCQTISDACHYINAAPRGNDPLAYVFEDLTATLAENEVSILAALSHIPEPVKIEWIASVSGIPERQAATMCKDLFDRAILRSDPDFESFELPRLAATFLGNLRGEAVTENGKRLIDFVIALVSESGRDNFHLYDQVEAKWPLVSAAIPLVMSADSSLVQRFCSLVSRFLEFSGRWDEVRLLAECGEEAAIAQSDYASAGRRASQLGWIAHLRGDSGEVWRCAYRAEDYLKKLEAPDDQYAPTLRLRGLAHRLDGQYSEASACFRRLLDILRRENEEGPKIASCLNSLAAVEHYAGDYLAAERDYVEAVRIARNAGVDMILAGIVGNLSDLKIDQRKWNEAEPLAREALLLAKKVGRKQLVAKDCLRLSKIVFNCKKYEEAMPLAETAAAMFESMRIIDKQREAERLLNEIKTESHPRSAASAGL